MQFTLTIDLGNEAMQTFHDLSLTLGMVSALFDENHEPVEGADPFDRSGRVRDLKGNIVGTWEAR